MSAGAPPQTLLGELTAPKTPQLDLRGPTSKATGLYTNSQRNKIV